MEDDTATERVWLADWRRRVAELYAEVRALARVDPAVAWRHWATEREVLFREHPQSPVAEAGRAAFRTLQFEYLPGLRWELPVIPDAVTSGIGRAGGGLGLALELPVSAGGTLSFSRIGWIDVPFPAGTRRLALYWVAGYAGGLFLPFRDATNGRETYGAGRYLLDGAKGADLGGAPRDGTLIVDFNFAYQPSCAFDPKWACPLAPPENRLDIEVRAGERIA